MKLSSSDFESFAVEEKKKDKLGRRVCVDTDTGRRAKCPPKEGASQPKEKAKEAKAPKEPKVAAWSVEDASQKIGDYLKNPESITPEAVGEVAAKLSMMTLAKLTELKKQLSVSASGSKMEFARKIAERALAAAKAEPKETEPAARPLSKSQRRAQPEAFPSLPVVDAATGNQRQTPTGKAGPIAEDPGRVRNLAKPAQERDRNKKAYNALQVILGDAANGLDLGNPEAVRKALLATLGKQTKQETPNEQESGSGLDRSGSRRDVSGDGGAGAGVAPETRGSGDQGADQGRDNGSQSAGAGAAGNVPASQQEVNRRLDRYGAFFRKKGQPHVADWLDKLKAHVNAVGGDAALKALGDEQQGYAGGDGEKVQYAGWGNLSEFTKHYLSRNGISLLAGGGAVADPSKRIVSAVAPSSDDAGVKSRGRDEDVFPSLQTLKNKLDEAKHLPGLEKSEDLSVLMGGKVGDGKVQGLTSAVVAKLDETYGKGGWIVKSYGDEAFAGYGIFFPQRVNAMRQDAQAAIWTAGENLGKYGFRLGRNPDGKVFGIVHETGDIYQFGTPEFEQTIHGDARHWAEKAAAASASENGPMLPPGSFMAQPAFQVVGVSDADRAAGRTHEGTGEGRVHIRTVNGKAEIVPHSTWIKGDHMPVVFEDEHTQAMAQAAVDAINALPPSERQGQLYAPDIVRTADGFRVVEANPANEAGASGYLEDNPLIMDSYVSHVTGREPAHVQFVRNLLRGRMQGRKAEARKHRELRRKKKAKLVKVSQHKMSYREQQKLQPPRRRLYGHALTLVAQHTAERMPHDEYGNFTNPERVLRRIQTAARALPELFGERGYECFAVTGPPKSLAPKAPKAPKAKGQPKAKESPKSGEFKDARGYRYCLEQGKRVKCAPKEGEGDKEKKPKAEPKAKEAKAPKESKVAAWSVEDASKAIGAHLDKPESVTPEVLADVASKLSAMHMNDLNALKKQLSVKVGGTKIDQARTIAEKALAAAKQEPKEPVAEPKPKAKGKGTPKPKPDYADLSPEDRAELGKSEQGLQSFFPGKSMGEIADMMQADPQGFMQALKSSAEKRAKDEASGQGAAAPAAKVPQGVQQAIDSLKAKGSPTEDDALDAADDFLRSSEFASMSMGEQQAFWDAIGAGEPAGWAAQVDALGGHLLKAATGKGIGAKEQAKSSRQIGAPIDDQGLRDLIMESMSKQRDSGGSNTDLVTGPTPAETGFIVNSEAAKLMGDVERLESGERPPMLNVGFRLTGMSRRDFPDDQSFGVAQQWLQKVVDAYSPKEWAAWAAENPSWEKSTRSKEAKAILQKKLEQAKSQPKPATATQPKAAPTPQPKAAGGGLSDRGKEVRDKVKSLVDQVVASKGGDGDAVRSKLGAIDFASVSVGDLKTIAMELGGTPPRGAKTKEDFVKHVRRVVLERAESFDTVNA